VDEFGLATNCKTILKLPFRDIQICSDDGQQPSDLQAKSSKRMSGSQLDKACRNNNFEDAHDLKKQFGLSSDSDIFADSDGNMYYGPRQGTGTPQYMWMNTEGPH
jgi:hypothetical protein